MALPSGTQLGPYRIESPAGAGGMGEVYKAKDVRLDRTVAIKILPAQVASDPDMKLRFEREAKAISSLNHPNICTLHDIGHHEGVDYLVMEYLEGESLANRLLKGPLPVPELLAIAMQIAEALDKAHRQGLVHRDLKPGNIMLTKGGAKLLDFGLAKLQEVAGVVQGVSGITRTTPLTGEGAIIGTLQYMAPEQLEGKEADARSDIFAFGAILYEMITGRRAFEGNSQASLIASIIKEQPRPIIDTQPLSPPMLERVIRQCLEKDPEHRWHTAGDLKRALLWINEGGSQVGVPLQVSVRRKARERVLWAAAGVLAVATAAMAWMLFMQPAPEKPVARFAIGQDARFASVTWPLISPDGKTLAFQARDTAGTFMIWVRPINSLDPYPLVGTEESRRPFWSPDSKYLAFFDNRNQLKRIPVGGGPTQFICEAQRGADGTWGSSGIILFDGAFADSICQVPAAGGPVTFATVINRAGGETGHSWPSFMPDGKHFLFLSFSDSVSAGDETLLMVGNIESEETKKLGISDSRAVYHPSGHILYRKDKILVAHPFDADKLEFTGDPIPVANDVTSASERALFSVSDGGQLVYLRGTAESAREIVVCDRDGKELRRIGAPERYENIALSPDGKRLAYDVTGENLTTADIWVRDLERDVSSRLTFDPGIDAWPVWNPDGASIYFTSNRRGGTNSNGWDLYRRQANGIGDDQRITVNDSMGVLTQSLSTDGKTMIVMSATGGADIHRVDLESGAIEPLLTSQFFERWATLSPNGRYLAYTCNESGRPEIYVRELSPTGGKWQVSSNRGRMPQWRADGKELFFVNYESDFLAVPVNLEGGLSFGQPKILFNRPYYFEASASHASYQVSKDGLEFLIITTESRSGTAEFVVVQNWLEELKER